MRTRSLISVILLGLALCLPARALAARGAVPADPDSLIRLIRLVFVVWIVAFSLAVLWRALVYSACRLRCFCSVQRARWHCEQGLPRGTSYLAAVRWSWRESAYLCRRRLLLHPSRRRHLSR